MYSTPICFYAFQGKARILIEQDIKLPGIILMVNFTAFRDPLTVKYTEMFQTDFSYLSIY